MNGTHRAVILGTLAQRHPAYSELKALAALLAQLCAASVGCITEGANAAGAYLAGAVPHREPGGAAAAAPGLNRARHVGIRAACLRAVGRASIRRTTSESMPAP